MSSGCRKAIGLVEVLLAVALLAVIGSALLQMTSRGAQLTARGTEVQLASVVGASVAGASVIDRLLAEGYPGLQRFAGTEGA